MSSLEGTRHLSINRRLQGVLVLMIVWDVVTLLAELSFGSPLAKVSDGHIGGILASRADLSGAAVVPILIYVYAFVRGPLRHISLLWLGAVEQGAGALFSVYHFAAGDIKLGGMIAPLVISSLLLVVLLINLPRGQSSA